MFLEVSNDVTSWVRSTFVQGRAIYPSGKISDTFKSVELVDGKRSQDLIGRHVQC